MKEAPVSDPVLTAGTNRTLDNFRTLTVVVNHLFRHEMDKVKNEDLYKFLQDFKRPTGSGGFNNLIFIASVEMSTRRILLRYRFIVIQLGVLKPNMYTVKNSGGTVNLRITCRSHYAQVV